MEAFPVCRDCGACCASFRVSFYWGEADDAPGGWVPVAATERLNRHLRCMRGTNSATPRCDQLQGAVPGALCRMYDNRPGPCRDMQPYTPDGAINEQCTRARANFGLPPVPALSGSPPSAN